MAKSSSRQIVPADFEVYQLEVNERALATHLAPDQTALLRWAIARDQMSVLETPNAHGGDGEEFLERFMFWSSHLVDNWRGIHGIVNT